MISSQMHIRKYNLKLNVHQRELFKTGSFHIVLSIVLLVCHSQEDKPVETPVISRMHNQTISNCRMCKHNLV